MCDIKSAISISIMTMIYDIGLVIDIDIRRR